MPLIINELPKQQPKEIRMGKQPVADYYPPGATEPQVRPANVPAPNENPEGIVTKSDSVSEAVETAKEKAHEDVAKTPKKSARKK